MRYAGANYLKYAMIFRARGKTLDLTRTNIMGVVNITTDSFSGDGNLNIERAITYAQELVAQGADSIDIGAESSKPGATQIQSAIEIERLLPVVISLLKTDVVVSIDTYKLEVARVMLEAGVHIINDIHGGRDLELLALVAKYEAGYVLMHMQGNPDTMQQYPTYTNVISELITFFTERVEKALAAGISPESIMIDPGIGFGKTLEHNLEIVRSISRIKEALPYPILLGVSRKKFIGTITGVDIPKERLMGTAASVAIGVSNGASVVRVHDVSEMCEVVKMADALR